ncbi:MAG: DMT family transporter [Albidovulum sp.]
MSSINTLPSGGPAALTGNMACIASMLVWAVGFPIADELLQVLPPMTVILLRIVMATAFLLPIWLICDGWQEVRASNWARGLWVGAIGVGVGALLVIYAQKRTDGITVAVILATMPIAGIALECLLDGRKLRARLIIGIILSTVGGISVYGARMGHFDLGLGAAAALVSVVIFAWGGRASVAALPGHSALARTTITMMGAAVIVILVQLCIGAYGGDPIPWQRIGAQEWTYLAIYGIGALALAQLFFLIGVAGLGIGIATMHMNIAPFYVMVLAVQFGASWSWLQVFGASIVALGVIIAQGRPRKA